MCQHLKGATKGILKNKAIASDALLWNQERSETNGEFTATHEPYPPCKPRGVDVQDKSVNMHNPILAVSKGIKIQL